MTNQPRTKTVLFIEDNTSTIESILQALEFRGLHLIHLVAESHERAREILSQESIDLIILDGILPDATAIDILEDLRSRDIQTPVIILTGYPEELDREKANNLDVVYFFSKPFNADEFVQILESFLGKSN